MRKRIAGPLSYGVLAAAVLGVFVVAARVDGQKPPSKDIQGSPMYMVLPKDAIPSIDDPQLLPIQEASGRAEENEIFLGVVLNGEAHAYSTWLLDSHEIVNDVVGGVAVAAEW